MKFISIHSSLVIIFSLIIFSSSCDNNEEFDDEEPAQVVMSGSGSVVFNDYQPLANKPITLFYHIPAEASSSSRILIVLTGNSRDARESRDALIAKADRYSYIVVVPEFTRSSFPGGDVYNLGNMFVDGDNPSANTLNPEEVWTFSVIGPIFEKVKKLTGNINQSFDLFGFSAGAQFVHRLLIFKRELRVGKIVAASAGWYTVPDFQVDFPYGLGLSPFKTESYASLFNSSLTIIVGENDNDPNASSLRRNQYADAQGNNRLDRAKYFYQRSQTIAFDNLHSFNWSYQSLPRTSHNFEPLANHAMDAIFSK